jgi:hypothetical protein
MINGETKTLREWIDTLKITPCKYTYESTGNTYETYKSEIKKERNGFIEIFTLGGYGLPHGEIEKFLDELFFIQNADIGDARLQQKYW